MPKYEASDDLLWSDDETIDVYAHTVGREYPVKEIILPEGTTDSSFQVKFSAHLYTGATNSELWGFPAVVGDSFFRFYVEDLLWKDFVFTVSKEGTIPSIGMVMFQSSGFWSHVEVKNFRVYGTEVYSGICTPFLWVGDVFLTIGQVLRSIGDRIGTVWWVGDVIQAWFNTLASYFESARDWFYSLGDWCGQIVQGLQLGAAWVWIQTFFSDPAGYVTELLGDAWIAIREMQGDFSSWVFATLGDAWDDLLDLSNNFTARVFGVLGDTWTNVVGMYNNFTSWVLNALGDTWTDLQDLSANLTEYVINALGGTWSWLVEFVENPMSKISQDILELVKSGFEWLTQEWFSFIDTSWDTFKGSFEWLLQKLFLLLDESWDNFEESLKWFLGRCMDLVGDAAEDLKYQIWEMVEKVVKRL